MTLSAPGRRARLPLHTRILLGLALGALAGVTANLLWGDAPAVGWLVDNVAQPVGQVFLRMLFMVVVPLVFTSLVLGVAGLGDPARLGRIGVRTMAFFLLTTGAAAVLGLALVNVVRPGDALDPEIREGLMADYAGQAAERVDAAEATDFGIQTFVQIVPRNPVDAAARPDMLGLIFFSIVSGLALTQIPRRTAEPVLRLLEGILRAVEVVIGYAMRLAPYGVAGLIFAVTARFGFGLLASLSLYALVVLVGLAIHQFVTLGLVARIGAGLDPRLLFRRARTLMVTAFSTSSSNATLPTTVRTATDGLGVPREVAGFVLPLGATMNMNGTALFEGVTVLFLAQAFGVEMSLATQGIVVVLVILTAIGASGVPSGSIPLLVLILETVGIPGEGIALVLGIDRILDMARTVPNVTGDLITSVLVARTEGVWTPADVPPEGAFVTAPAATGPLDVDAAPHPAGTPAAVAGTAGAPDAGRS